MNASLPPDPFVGLNVPSESARGVVYRIDRLLGEGGTAVAYLATRQGPDGQSPAVLKIILPSIVVSEGDTAQTIVRKEAVALARMNERVPPCPFVVRLLDVGTIEYAGRGRKIPLPWLAIEYVHGGPYGATLEDRIDRTLQAGVAFEPERALRVVSQVCEGLREVHEAGIIHRDITPNNVLCCGSGSSELFKISDFGIARPIGMHATFGNTGIGTPGYVAPEQATTGEGTVGFHSDVFSLGALTYFVLTGENYFPAKNLFEVLATAKNPQRRSIRDARGLAPELRDDSDACQAIDEALALATSADPKRRPQTAKAFAASITPWLAGCPPTRQSHVLALSPVAVAQTASDFRVVVRHPVGHDWVLSRIGWDADGHCLGASTRGIVYFDGTTWLDVPTQTVPGITRAHFAARAAAGRWLLGGDGGAVAEYSRAGVSRVIRGFDQSLSLYDANGDVSDLVALLAARPGTPPLVTAICGGRWLKPVPVAAASALLGLARLDDERWLVCGRSVEGRGLVALYAPTRWETELLPSVDMRAFTACASRPERNLAVAVGARGVVYRLDGGKSSLQQLPGEPELSAVAIDLLGRVWAGAAGELWFCETEASGFRRVWQDPNWRAPFVSIFAELGLVFAATADGAVLEVRAGTLTGSG